ncbi:hypothetical protein A3C98_00675 [Candidatus Roizmanbacteria bacterium RIFCSPHIGHO2_02_FULL_37_15]|uniref:Uncharacterized protein n=1 Tax=Candidatus Roizmanbacteria bacterium RIFCSPLOWO2_01_FULL_37_16 TaxID=1802058 RepID=A0A1F7INX3_9BACT|nr:MAG: hypothetical protein A2859_03665 [Candidatus Roizmanbacteria bacterium RIFCSPHIGHO2_01_FULL_37_16b]OGK21341.1 MAG: hypothetical protein A3C98_00675 [Candidatus Roizmanbacteria bacterium RIFCSPHIGHO2_02_FULL_37_15]OGK32272.1 MAG: hypothetical protein A3F57_03795 [Candidatus Roizmanbacteria bacterium RIFCSPHIGHO2_12_FULL_36_11]OGK45031.1 MAG: hypothetical protein A3B40_01280 [Candidatus Roizmanbacteria bacterium RIFCSPLOWO2_01_FULL_37_16]
MKHLTYSLLKILAIIFFFSFLVLNLTLSQYISPLYFQLMKEDKNAAIRFLSKIKNLPYFLPLLEVNKNIYDNSLEQEVFAEDIKRKKIISQFESLLQKNPKSRDILYNLYLLHNEDGNKIMAQEYLRRAKEIDPSIDK